MGGGVKMSEKEGTVGKRRRGFTGDLSMGGTQQEKTTLMRIFTLFQLKTQTTGGGGGDGGRRWGGVTPAAVSRWWNRRMRVPPGSTFIFY